MEWHVFSEAPGQYLSSEASYITARQVGSVGQGVKIAKYDTMNPWNCPISCYNFYQGFLLKNVFENQNKWHSH